MIIVPVTKLHGTLGFKEKIYNYNCEFFYSHNINSITKKIFLEIYGIIILGLKEGRL